MAYKTMKRLNEITGQPNELWDGIWQSYGKVTEFGYQVEMEIPYQILNFDQQQTIQHWPFEFVRIYPREQRLRISNVKTRQRQRLLALPISNGDWL